MAEQGTFATLGFPRSGLAHGNGFVDGYDVHLLMVSARCLCNAWAGLGAACALGLSFGGWPSVTVQHPILLYNHAPSPTAFRRPRSLSHLSARSLHRINQQTSQEDGTLALRFLFRFWHCSLKPPSPKRVLPACSHAGCLNHAFRTSQSPESLVYAPALSPRTPNTPSVSFRCESAMAYDNSQVQASTNYKEAFQLFDKRGNGRVTVDSLGDLLRACGQNPTIAEIKDLEKQAGGECKSAPVYTKHLRKRPSRSAWLFPHTPRTRASALRSHLPNAADSSFCVGKQSTSRPSPRS